MKHALPFAFLLLFGGLVCTGDALAARHALLVGAWKYPNLPAERQLVGPKNDVELTRQALIQRGFKSKQIHLLSDGVAGSEGRPTRQAILDTLDRLARQVHRGDFVYLHFSGHGSQQPVTADKRTEEPDGLDEIFLPSDVGQWDGKTGAVKNAITDNEIGTRLAAIRARGAFVWAVFDTCHSGSMTRAFTPPETRDRYIDPRELGIPVTVVASPNTVASASLMDFRVETTRGGKDDGQLVAFFAAQPNQITKETPLPLGKSDRRPLGVFTFALLQSLQLNPNATYRQLMQQILFSYSTLQLTPSIPYSEGNALDSPAFSAQPKAGQARLRQWEVKNQRLQAGALDLIAEGAVLAVVPRAVSGDGEVLGCVRVTEVNTKTAALEGIDYTRSNNSQVCPALKPENFPRGAHARLMAEALPFTLGVALADHLAPALRDQLSAVLAGAQQDPRTRGLIRVVPSAERADVVLSVGPASNQTHGSRLWFVPPGGELLRDGPRPTYSIPVQADQKAFANSIFSSLAHIAKAHNLLRLGQHTQPAPALGIKAKWFAMPGTRRADGECKATAGPRREISLGQMHTFKDCTRLEIELGNNGVRALDITLVTLDARYGVAVSNGERLAPGQTLSTGVTITSDVPGLDRLLILASKAAVGPPMDFSFIAQDTLKEAATPLPSAARGDNDIYSLLYQAGFGTAAGNGTRSQSTTTLDSMSVLMLQWITEK